MNSWKCTASIIVSLLLSGCVVQEQPAKKRTGPSLVGQFQSQSFYIAAGEKIVVFDIPDYGMPRRCLIYINETVQASRLDCGLEPSLVVVPNATHGDGS